MDFKEILEMIVNKDGYEALNDIFRVHSILSDYVTFTPSKNKIISLYSEIYKECNLVDLFKTKGLNEGRKYLISIYPKYKSKCTIDEFKEAINPISYLICPEEYENYQKVKQENINKNKIIKQVNVVKNNNANAPQKNQVPTITNDVIKKIKLIYSVGKMTIVYNKTDDLEIVSESLKPITPTKQTFNNGILNLTILRQGSNIIIKLPKSCKLKKLEIFGEIGSLVMQDKINAKDAVIYLKEGYHYIKVKGENLKVGAQSLSVDLECDIKNLFLNNTNGNVYYNLYLDGKRKANLNLNVLNGNIFGFFYGHSCSRLTRVLFKTRSIHKTVMIGKCEATLNIDAPNGRIRIF